MWTICVDTGGTFTDAVGLTPDGVACAAKVLSSSRLRTRILGRPAPDRLGVERRWPSIRDLPLGWSVVGDAAAQPFPRVTGYDPDLSVLSLDRPAPEGWTAGALLDLQCPEPAPVLAARLLTGTPGGAPLPNIRMRLATTRGTNALLTRQFAPPVLVITRGLGDLLEIGTQQRPERDLFSLAIRKPVPLHGPVIEVGERLRADGSVLLPLDAASFERDARRAFEGGARSAAVALLHSDLNPEHERAAARVLERVGFTTVALSHRVAPFVKILPRAVTAVVEASLAPVVSEYISGIRAALGPGSRLDILTSAGGLNPSDTFRACDSLLSGPAGGVLGAAAAAVQADEPEILAFDVGGTSTDVSRWTRRGGFEHAAEHSTGDATLIATALRIHTVAAGGGSICGFDGAALTVGPASAGADPGPACYGAGGPLTLTDVQLLAGRMSPEDFGLPLDVARADQALDSLLAAMPRGAGAPTRERVLDGLLDIAAERVAGAIQVVSSRRGHDPSRATLLAFGGAGGQIACLVAERLRIRRILVPPDAGLLSARGLMRAPFQAIGLRQILRPLAEVRQNLSEVVGSVAADAEAELRRLFAAICPEEVRRRTDFALRWSGQESTVEVTSDQPDADALVQAFLAAYEQLYGHVPDRELADLELVWIRVIAAAEGAPVAREQRPDAARRAPTPPRHRPMRSGGAAHDAAVLDRRSLPVGSGVSGPAVITDPHSTTVVDVGWSATVAPDGALLLVPGAARSPAGPSDRLDAADVELFTSRFESAAMAMGAALQRTSVSVNVKERLDYSCAVLDDGGRLVACAPHVPVHLGSLGVCVREVLARVPIGPGDAVVTNHPGCGGSHLPDVTVIAGAFDRDSQPIGYVAARAHHAEIGGVRPGSMPPGAARLSDEGVVIPPMYAVRAGHAQLEALHRLLAEGGGVSVPSRAIEANLQDIRAAIAACRSGARELEQLATAYDRDHLARAMHAILDRSAAIARTAISGIGERAIELADELDDGTPLRVRLSVSGGRLTVDFSGTSDVHPGNLNATPAIVRSCLVYLMRVLAGRDLPLNEGLMRDVDVVLPRGMLNPPFDPAADPRLQPAVVGGNVETSQRLVNMVLRGLGRCAESQGTMNNLVFGDASCSAYETICGGAGAGPGFSGASAVHTHMTNTRITDPEILERRYPVRLDRFAVRRGSGGDGLFRGGNGAERVIRFLAPMSLSVLTQHRVRGPRGLDGGSDGLPGAQWIEGADGSRRPLRPMDAVEVGPDDAIVIQTPGGGGWGAR